MIGGTPKLIDMILAEAEVAAADIDLFVFHQPNGVMLEKLFERLGIGKERTYINFPWVGNTVAASVPLALTEAWRAGRIAPGSRVLLGAVGAGVTGGAHVLRWTMARPQKIAESPGFDDAGLCLAD